MDRKKDQRSRVSHGILTIGKVLFESSDSEDDDPDRKFYVSDQIVEAAGRRSYTMTRDMMIKRRNVLFKGKPPFKVRTAVITNPVEMTDFLKWHKDQWFLQDGVKPDFEIGWEDLKL